jgi:hypothetical protein
VYLDFAAATTENRAIRGFRSASGGPMKVTLTLDATAGAVRAALTEEWDGIGGPAKMAAMVRLFDTEAQAIAWARALAHRRRLDRIYLTDNRRNSRQ